jgi:hypothetical protein
MSTTDNADKHRSIWYRYFVEPKAYARDATAISRNILNVGLASLIVGLFAYGPHTTQYELAFRDFTNDYLESLSTRSGNYSFVTGGKSSTPRACVVESATGKELACSSGPLVSHPMNAEAETAVAWIDPQYGVVRMTLGDLEIVAPNAIQTRLRNGIMIFLGLICVFLACLTIAIYRQVSLVSAYQKVTR